MLAVGLLIFLKRFDLAVLYLEGNKKAQELVIIQMVGYAKPIVQTEFKMTIFEKIFSALAGKRNQKERQADALKDVRAFCEICFKDHRLKFMNVHRRGSQRGFNLRGFDLALGWNEGTTGEVLIAFNVDFLKRAVGALQLNENCGFFTALRAYVEKKVQEN